MKTYKQGIYEGIKLAIKILKAKESSKEAIAVLKAHIRLLESVVA